MIDAIVSEVERFTDGLTVTDEAALVRQLYEVLHLRRAPSSDHARSSRHAFSAAEIFGRVTRNEDGWRPLESPGAGTSIFEKAGLRVRVDARDVVADGVLSLPAIRDRLSPAFAGLLSPSEPPDQGVRVYVPVARDAAPEAGRMLARAVREVTTRYIVKALSVKEEYPRPDAFTIYLSRSDLEPVLEALGEGALARFFTSAPRHSLFAKIHGSGVSWIEGPARDSAGQVRAACVARALRSRLSARESLAAAVGGEFAAAGIDAAEPYRLVPEVSYAG
ncbi:T3SS effector HopA1 family protein [Microbacterium arborescens]